jgi:formiminotetrahydrofolate cyclodeaminase
MEMTLVDEKVKDFLASVASRKATPGGGSVSALVAALGVSLAEMAANLTVGNEKYSDVQGEMESALSMLNEKAARLSELIDEDAKVFEPLAAAYRSKDESLLQRLYLESANVPLEIMHVSLEALGAIHPVIEKGNRLLVSDALCAKIFVKAAIEAAYQNVLININALTDRGAAEEIDAECKMIIEESEKI